MFTLLIIFISIFALVKSAGVFVNQSTALAKKLNVSDFLIGFTIVAFGTSIPELISTIFSALSGHNQLVVTNIIGSNITNFCLIFGLIAIFNDFRIRKRDVDINIPLNMAALMVFWALAVFMGFSLNWSAGISLILIFVILQILSKEYNHLKITSLSYPKFRPIILIGSLIILIVSGKICIDQIIILAKQLNVAETILGYFLLALGTSLPELITTWTALKKKEGELALGSVLGSNIFNLLFIFSISTFINPVELSAFKIDLVFLTGITLIVYIFAITGKKYSFSKKEGISLFLLYLTFIAFQAFKS